MAHEGQALLLAYDVGLTFVKNSVPVARTLSIPIN